MPLVCRLKDQILRAQLQITNAVSAPFTSFHPEGDSAVPMCFVSDAPARVDLLIAISSAEALLPDSIAARAKLRITVSLINRIAGRNERFGSASAGSRRILSA